MSPPTSHADALIHRFRYTRWANDAIIDALRSCSPDVQERDAVQHAQGLLSHLLRAQLIWWGRVADAQAASLDVWAQDDLDTCAARSAESTSRWIEHLKTASETDLEATIRYRNSKGTPFSTRLQVIANHVVTHSAHHRGQIALDLRRADVSPPVTDYIAFVRTPAADPQHPLHALARVPAPHTK